MPKFTVYFTAMVDKEVVVEANSKTEAMDLVKDKEVDLSGAEDSTDEYYVHSTAYAEEVT